jgi:hypothetical protein
MRGPLALADELFELGAFLLAQPDHVFLDGNLWAGHESSLRRRLIANAQIQTLPSNAMT